MLLYANVQENQKTHGLTESSCRYWELFLCVLGLYILHSENVL